MGFKIPLSHPDFDGNPSLKITDDGTVEARFCADRVPDDPTCATINLIIRNSQALVSSLSDWKSFTRAKENLGKGEARLQVLRIERDAIAKDRATAEAAEEPVDGWAASISTRERANRTAIEEAEAELGVLKTALAAKLKNASQLARKNVSIAAIEARLAFQARRNELLDRISEAVAPLVAEVWVLQKKIRTTILPETIHNGESVLMGA